MYLHLKGTGLLTESSGLRGIDWTVPEFKIGHQCRAGSGLEGKLRNYSVGPDGTPCSTIVHVALPPGPDEPVA